MNLSPQQDQALQQVSKWLKNPGKQQVFRLFGFAGTGKTTLAKHFCQDVSGPVHFCAFTGKAAKVLREKGCPGSTTIHKLIYQPKNKSQVSLKEMSEEAEQLEKQLPDIVAANKLCAIKQKMREEEENLRRPSFSLNHDSDACEAALLVVDECSMVDERMGRDLLTFKKPILVLGDPAQLPPVAGGGFFTEQDPDFMLTEIHRQAADNPILEMSRRIREGETLEVGNYGESRVHSRGVDLSEIALEVDQMIAGRNRTRHASNRRVRSLLGLSSHLPETGDRMVCLKNNHKRGLLNGAIYAAGQDAMENEDEPRAYDLLVHSEDSDGEVNAYSCWKASLGGDTKDIPYWELREHEQFDFGYCLTCHKAQGSQWDHVLVMDESHVFRRDARRWLYTAVTRAAERIDIVQI